MVTNGSSSTSAAEGDAGSEAINFRAALAAFEQHSSPHVGSPSGASRRAPLTPARPSAVDPVVRSASTPRHRSHSTSRATVTPGRSVAAVPAGSMPTTSASGMLGARSPAVAAASPTLAGGSLRKSESGLSLRELMAKSLPRGASPMQPSRAGADEGVVGSGRSTPTVAPRAIVGLFAPDPSEDPRRTSSPGLVGQERHELDASTDQDHTHPMFAHAVMARSHPASPERKASVESTTSTTSTTSSTSTCSTTPRLPPRPTQQSLAPSPTLTEFGQFQPSATKGVEYATYTPGGRRGRTGAETHKSPPALPPRSATLGTNERSKQRDPPSVPKKPAKPAPPPRPTAPPGRTAPDGAARGFRFGTPPSEAAGAQPAPPARTRPAAATPASSLTPNTHRKSGSSVFTSISLSDEATSELRRTLESDVRTDAQLPPPARGRPAGTPLRATAGTGAGTGTGMVSTLIGTAASVVPLFKSGATPAPAGAGARSLADGAPSKQYAGGVSRSASTQSELSVRPGQADAPAWVATRAVQLADTPKRTRTAPAVPTWWKTPDEASRRRYETLFAQTLAAQSRRRSARAQRRDPGRTSQADAPAEVKPRGSGVQALRGWFESDASPAPTTVTLPDEVGEESREERLSAASVRRVWMRSRLPERFLAQVWEYAVQSSAEKQAGMLGRDAFVCALASIDAELARRKARRRDRPVPAPVPREVGGRRVPPPPRAM